MTAAAKRRLRAAMRGLRQQAFRAWQGARAAALLRDQVLPELGFCRHNPGPDPAGRHVAGYWPMPGEADPLPALRMLAAAGWTVALPEILVPRVGASQVGAPAGSVPSESARAGYGELLFRAWPPHLGAPPPGAHGIPAPPPDRPSVRPDLLLVPLLAVDCLGRRLGQGAGYYDRVLTGLRGDGAGPVVAVGWAMECQVLRQVPATARDAPLDWIVTERRALRCRADGR